ncbi:hypothetical protein CANARDRAFT_200193 [[Candida] arabinofermentans NRRL YB-2248]|uniref:Signal recognition particle receptor subunit alpha homolog n=1 Tax=[Candida] arabinofermentans NRRL YB-2248 TaxID=983967 RepID=A0A1E4SZ77_9ASCO|nr:hypothetical protein CANARDRAFT_200193 [[Candida] arabinofermentans NRRL YB-2248]
MIDQFLIFRPTGQVEFNYQPGKNLSSITNSFIQDRLISERNLRSYSELEKEEQDEENEGIDADETQILGTYSLDNYSLKYLVLTESNRKLVFAMIYSPLMNFKNPFEFLKNIKHLYLNTSDKAKFDSFFALNLKELEKTKTENQVNSSDEKELLEESKTPTISNNKKLRKWNADGSFYEDGGSDSTALDFSSISEANDSNDKAKLDQLIGNRENFGSKTKSGEFLVSDLSEEMDRIMSLKQTPTALKSQQQNSSSTSQSFGFLRGIIGGKKIEKEDVQKVKSALSNHLIKKNVAPNVANSLISEIEKELIGSKTANFTSVEETAKKSLERQLIKLLTPNSSIDLLNEIQSKKKKGSEPYVISVVGVNGVGKSTNLSKLAYWLLQNDYRVLITACDTFRSGAVEQLRTHVNNLTKLSPNTKQIELFEGGYGGADLVAKIATGAIKYAKENKFDIVLLDTAGRRHNDSKLMAPLASFAKAANPDKIIMVGEALVGTDSVMQAQNFNKAFGANRHLDFFIVSKCDTVGDMIGSMVNMVYATGIPILFVGTGQTYTDIRTLSVSWAVNMLMS